MMIDLNSNQWQNLNHAYGEASNIPDLLRDLSRFPKYENYESEPYFSLWSALCHQGDAYTASYAAVPHIIDILASDPHKANLDLFLLPTCIEIARIKGNGPEIPKDIEKDYFESLKRIPALSTSIMNNDLDYSYIRVLTAAIAVAKGHTRLGETILELSEDVLEDFSEWVMNR